MSDIQTRDRSLWAGLFEVLTLGRRGEDVTIEVLSAELGDQKEADHLRLDNLTYDDRGDVVVLSLSARQDERDVVLRHLVHQPREVDLHEGAGDSLVVRIVDRDGEQTLLTVQPQPARG